MLYKFLTVLSIFCASVTFAVDLPKTGEKRELPEDIVSEQPPVKKIPYALHKACKEGNIEKVKALLMTEDINEEGGNYGYSPILIAFFFGQDHVVDILLLDENIDINTSDKNGESLLHYACRYPLKEKERAVKFIEKLMARPLRIFMNACNKKHETPLYVACATNNLSVVKELLKHPRTDVNFCDLNLWGPLHVACSTENSEEVVEELLKRPELNLEARCKLVKCQELEELRVDSLNPLHLACEKGNEKVVKLLLETNKININEITKTFSYTALDIAINNRQLSIVKLLIKEKTITVYSTLGKIINKILFSKKIDGDDEVIIQAFVDYHWSEIRRGDKISLIKACLKCKKIGLIDLILEKNKENQAVEDDFILNEGDLFLSLCNDSEIIISDILKKLNVDLNIQNRDGETPLHLVVTNRTTENAKTLIDNNANINSENKSNLTPLDKLLKYYCVYPTFVIKKDAEYLIEYMLNKGALCSESFNENEKTKNLLEEIRLKILENAKFIE